MINNKDILFNSDYAVELVKHIGDDKDVISAARVSTVAELSLEYSNDIVENNKGLIKFLMRNRHGTPFEHNSMTFFIQAPIFVFREFMRHRVGFCLVGDTELTLLNDKKIAIEDYYNLYFSNDNKPDILGVNEDTLLFEYHKVSDVYYVGKVEVINILIKGNSITSSLNHKFFTATGWKVAIDLKKGDYIFYSDNSNVILEQIEDIIHLGVKDVYDCSINNQWHNFLANNFVVHNSYNEESGRYAKLKPIFYIPDYSRPLKQVGKPGAYTFVQDKKELTDLVIKEIKKNSISAYKSYMYMLDNGVAKEMARAVLPLNIYSSMYVTCNARSLMSFLSLRTHRDNMKFLSYPQYEIEMVANKMEKIFAKVMPYTFKYFDELGRVSP